MSTTPNDGGPAFPQIKTDMKPSGYGQGSVYGDTHSHGGMTLRDWFAGQALAGLAGNFWDHSNSEMAGRSYRIADAMLAARTPPQPLA